MLALIPVIAAMVISLLSLGVMQRVAAEGQTKVTNAFAAGQLLTADSNFLQYVKDNATTIASVATASVPFRLTGAQLIAAGEAPTGWSATNVFRQTWLLEVFQPTVGQMQAVVTSQGGVAVSDPKQLVAIAARGQGGFVPFANQFGDTTMAPNAARGAFGSFNVPLAGFTNPGAGHFATLLNFSSADSGAGSQFLYRVQVPGQPQLNDMQTDLGLTGIDGTAHNITGANQISTQSLEALSDGTQAVPSVTMADGKVVSWNQLGTGGVLGLVGANGQSVFLESQNGTFTLMNSAFSGPLFTVDQNGNVIARGSVQPGNVATPRATCTGTGVAGNTDGSGMMLSCQAVPGGREWLPIGGTALRYGFFNVENGTGVPAPNCPAGGTPQIVVTTQPFSVDDTATVNPTVTGTGPWTVNFTDGVGAAIAAQGVAETYCGF